MSPRPRPSITPRMLTKEQAAVYCGVSPTAFMNVCPLPAVAIGNDVRLYRWDVRLIDQWLDTLAGTRIDSVEVEPTMAELMERSYARPGQGR